MTERRTLAGRAALRMVAAMRLGRPLADAGRLQVDRTCTQCGAPHGQPHVEVLHRHGPRTGRQVLVHRTVHVLPAPATEGEQRVQVGGLGHVRRDAEDATQVDGLVPQACRQVRGAAGGVAHDAVGVAHGGLRGCRDGPGPARWPRTGP